MIDFYYLAESTGLRGSKMLITILLHSPQQCFKSYSGICHYPFHDFQFDGVRYYSHQVLLGDVGSTVDKCLKTLDASLKEETNLTESYYPFTMEEVNRGFVNMGA
ncbi:hypothetical protein ACJIZ3_010281 [Penstemon smallii]|uniref:Uncharacterized protein n=1 Tax=Penstemon smallii TaxID=265156 RepID=A0ABD3TFS7_9LAMI